MGADAADYDGDGRLDVFVTNFSQDHNTLYRNSAEGFFSDVSHQARVVTPSLANLGWGTGFADFDNDGLLDLFVANGHVYPEIDRLGTRTTYRQPKQLFKNRGQGTFQRRDRGRGRRAADREIEPGRGVRGCRQRRRRRRARDQHERSADAAAQRHGPGQQLDRAEAGRERRRIATPSGRACGSRKHGARPGRGSPQRRQLSVAQRHARPFRAGPQDEGAAGESPVARRRRRAVRRPDAERDSDNPPGTGKTGGWQIHGERNSDADGRPRAGHPFWRRGHR